MEKLLNRFNYKGDNRICILNGGKSFVKSVSNEIPGVVIDNSIDPKYPYNFIVIFAFTEVDVDKSAPFAFHNLCEDGILWYVYPKNPEGDPEKALSRNKGWAVCKEAGFDPVRHICVDDYWSATRLRNKKYIRRKK